MGKQPLLPDVAEKGPCFPNRCFPEEGNRTRWETCQDKTKQWLWFLPVWAPQEFLIPEPDPAHLVVSHMAAEYFIGSWYFHLKINLSGQLRKESLAAHSAFCYCLLLVLSKTIHPPACFWATPVSFIHSQQNNSRCKYRIRQVFLICQLSVQQPGWSFSYFASWILKYLFAAVFWIKMCPLA